MECKYIDRRMTTHTCVVMFINILLSYVCVYLYIYMCVYLCVRAQRCMHMLRDLLFIGYYHTDS